MRAYDTSWWWYRREIEIATKTLGISKSELIRRSVKDYLAKIRKPSFGEVASSLQLEDIDEPEDLCRLFP